MAGFFSVVRLSNGRPVLGKMDHLITGIVQISDIYWFDLLRIPGIELILD
jgi:hypothetical protein